ncbi:hypothetical protein O0L34_g5351 [Tuta absoluta]|nr:hypothetical protein O0L34_g9822 [Tuta absoluta]KAJ2950974.1 hypothetical protein O0L34_g5351 [Tuta absoluta]
MAPCLKCTKPITKPDSANPKITCHGCERQICVKCSGLLATELRVVVLQSPTLKYLCPDCELGVRQLPALRKLVSDLEIQVKELRNKQNQCTSLEAVVAEIAERETRSSNVIMFGVPELIAETDVGVRKRHDLEQVVNSLQCIPESEKPVAIIRLGKPKQDLSPRPVKVIFANKRPAKNILKNGKKLPASIKVKNDLTPYQREYLKNLRVELDQRTSNGELNLTIKYVGNTPKIVTKGDDAAKK